MSKSEELKNYMPSYLVESRVFQNIYNAIGAELDSFNISKEDLFAQFFIDTATWSLDLWDGFAGTETRQLEVSERRNIIKVKLLTRPPSTKATLLDILKNFADDAEVTENTSEYSFDVILKTKTNLNNKLNYIIEQLELIKPAHLGYKIIIDYLTYLIAKINFTRYESDPFSLCGTLDDSGNPVVATEGRKYLVLISDKLSSYFSDVFAQAGESIYPDGVSGVVNSEIIADTKQTYFSIDILKCATNIYCGGGVYS